MEKQELLSLTSEEIYELMSKHPDFKKDAYATASHYHLPSTFLLGHSIYFCMYWTTRAILPGQTIQFYNYIANQE